MVEEYRYDSVLYALVIRDVTRTSKTAFVTAPEMPLQFGVQAHATGYLEDAHSHPLCARTVEATHQVVYIISGHARFDFLTDDGNKLGDTTLSPGDAILLTERGHPMVILDEVRTVTVKQGPYLGTQDKVTIQEADP